MIYFFIFNLFIISVYSQCMDGTYLSGSSCLLCNAGHYCKNGKQTKCPVGTFQAYQFQSSCMDCPAGTYQSSTGQTTCEYCPAGTYCPNVKTGTPTKCAKGTFNPGVGQTACIKCPAGYACPSEGLTSIDNQLCPPGTYSDTEGLSACKKCLAGYYCPASGMAIGNYYYSHKTLAY